MSDRAEPSLEQRQATSSSAAVDYLTRSVEAMMDAGRIPSYQLLAWYHEQISIDLALVREDENQDDDEAQRLEREIQRTEAQLRLVMIRDQVQGPAG